MYVPWLSSLPGVYATFARSSLGLDEQPLLWRRLAVLPAALVLLVMAWSEYRIWRSWSSLTTRATDNGWRKKTHCVNGFQGGPSGPPLFVGWKPTQTVARIITGSWRTAA